MTPPSDEPPTSQPVKTTKGDALAVSGGGGRLIWDLPTRVFHWALALCIAGSWFTAEQLDDAMDLHIKLGYVTATLLLFRLMWGFVGPRHARFSSFVRGPRAIMGYLRTLRDGGAPATPGHNPLGAVSVVAMLLAVAAQVSLGFFASDGFIYAGPYNPLVSEDLADEITDLHEANFKLIAVLVALHVIAILWYRVRKGEKLLVPMITGRKPATAVAPEAAIPGSRTALALVVLGIAALAIYLLVRYAPPPVDTFLF